jgi:tripartite-type tricarboxylate transporter receptor subunit TctC
MAACRLGLVTAAVVASCMTLPVPAPAQEWPARPVRLLVGFGPGGGTDIAARFVAQPLSELLGQPVVVENKPGAGGTAAADFVAKAPKDGYAGLMMSNAHAISAVMYKSLPYEPVKDFQMVSMVGTAGLVLVTSPNFPARDLKGVIAEVKANPGKYNFGSSGVGTTQHFSGELMRQLAGLDMKHIPYRAAPAVIAALRGNEVQLVFELIQAVQGQIRSGDLRPIAVTSAQRFPALADVPTFAESGLAGFDVTSWYGISFPAGTPAAVVDKTNRAMKEVLARDAVKKQLADISIVARPSTSEQLARHVGEEIAKWQRVRDQAGIAPQ